MSQRFKIKYFPREGQWLPDHPEIARACGIPDEDGTGDYIAIRRAMWQAIESMVPGEYLLEEPLEELRARAFRKIDARSDELIAAGFEFQGLVFSMSNEAQIRYAAMMMLAEGLPYPLGINSLDDNGILYLQNADHTRGFVLTSVGHVQGVVASGTEQKELVRNSSDPEYIIAFEDSRPRPTNTLVEPGAEQASQAPMMGMDAMQLEQVELESAPNNDVTDDPSQQSA